MKIFDLYQVNNTVNKLKHIDSSFKLFGFKHTKWGSTAFVGEKTLDKNELSNSTTQPRIISFDDP